MKILKKYIVFPSILFLLSTSGFSTNQTSCLWYTQPAKRWMTQALPIGNGYMGAMIFGGINEEHIQFNEKT